MTATVTKIHTALSSKQTGKLSREQIISGVRAHAAANRSNNEQVWQFIESLSDREIDTMMGKNTKSILGAIQVLADRRDSPLVTKVNQLQDALRELDQALNEINA